MILYKAGQWMTDGTTAFIEKVFSDTVCCVIGK